MGATAGKKKHAFIVCASHEVDLADSLITLLQYWGFEEAVHYRRDPWGAGGKDYLNDLRNKLLNADLVILLLSREFQWSKYCQAEAGLATTLDPEKLLIVVLPPSGEDDIKTISPILHTFKHLFADPRTFAEDLRSKVARVLRTVLPDRCSLETALEAELSETIEAYSLTPSKKEPLLIWPCITGEVEGQPAQHSIVQSIKKSLRNKQQVTELIFVGVSLKFSLVLITQALEEFSDGGRVSQPKTLSIELVHMDDQSHILQEDALDDPIDIKNIRDNFYRDWPGTLRRWEKACELGSVKLTPPRQHWIDYIPPRIGILIDGQTLFAGRCSFPHRGDAFQLFAGERPYFFYTLLDSHGKKAIEEFKDYLRVYRKANHNGVVLAPEEDWLRRLQFPLECDPSVREMTLISKSGGNFRRLVKCAIDKGISINIYLQNPRGSRKLKERIETFRGGVYADFRSRNAGSEHKEPRWFWFNHLATYRAALVGAAALGIQMYRHDPDGVPRILDLQDTGSAPVKSVPISLDTRGSKLCLIATRYSSQFEHLKKQLVEDFVKEAGVIEALAGMFAHKGDRGPGAV